LIETMKGQVSISSFDKLLAICLDTIGAPIEHCDHFRYSLGDASSAIKFFDGTEIPRPQASEGVMSMKWVAQCEGVSPVDPFDWIGFD